MQMNHLERFKPDVRFVFKHMNLTILLQRRFRSREAFHIHGEFDPGSGRTLAACLTHASRTGRLKACFYEPSGKRVSNAWATYRKDGDNIPKGVLIPNVVYEAHASYIKGFYPLSDGPASD